MTKVQCHTRYSQWFFVERPAKGGTGLGWGQAGGPEEGVPGGSEEGAVIGVEVRAFCAMETRAGGGGGGGGAAAAAAAREAEEWLLGIFVAWGGRRLAPY